MPKESELSGLVSPVGLGNEVSYHSLFEQIKIERVDDTILILTSTPYGIWMIKSEGVRNSEEYLGFAEAKPLIIQKHQPAILKKQKEEYADVMELMFIRAFYKPLISNELELKKSEAEELEAGIQYFQEKIHRLREKNDGEIVRLKQSETDAFLDEIGSIFEENNVFSSGGAATRDSLNAESTYSGIEEIDLFLNSLIHTRSEDRKNVLTELYKSRVYEKRRDSWMKSLIIIEGLI